MDDHPEKRFVVRFDYRPGFKEGDGIGVALYLTLYGKGVEFPLDEIVIWAGYLKPLKKSGDLSRHTWSRWKTIALALQRHVDVIPHEQLVGYMGAMRAPVLEEIADHIMLDARRTERKAKQGLVYSHGGWRVVHPLTTAWGVSPPDYIGSVTAIVDRVSQTVIIDAKPSSASAKTYKATGIREGIIQGLSEIYRVSHKFMDVVAVEKILDAAGVRNDTAGLLDTYVHRYLTNIITRITDAAHDEGVEGMNKCMQRLLEEAATLARDKGA